MDQAKEHLHTWKDDVISGDQEADKALSYSKQFTVSVYNNNYYYYDLWQK